jgi:type II secretory pathway predicted ATPase ExeA
MIEAYFGFKRPPFPKELKVDQMLDTYDSREAASRLAYIRSHRGILLLTGEPGAGKTSVLRQFVDGLNPQTHLHCYTPHATVSRSELYRQLNSLLSLPPKIRKSDLFDQIQRAVLELFENRGKTPVFILDEAHLMDHETLQELILVTNFQMDSRLPFILILIGQPDLREKLKRRMHEPLNQRITLRYHMAGLSLEETRPYLAHHLKIAGRPDPIFEDPAIEVLHQLGLGLPRKINNLATAALMIAMAKKKAQVDADLVVQASAGI